MIFLLYRDTSHLTRYVRSTKVSHMNCGLYGSGEDVIEEVGGNITLPCPSAGEKNRFGYLPLVDHMRSNGSYIVNLGINKTKNVSKKNGLMILFSMRCCVYIFRFRVKLNLKT